MQEEINRSVQCDQHLQRSFRPGQNRPTLCRKSAVVALALNTNDRALCQQRHLTEKTTRVAQAPNIVRDTQRALSTHTSTVDSPRGTCQPHDLGD